MTEDELRQLVRETVARHMGVEPTAAVRPGPAAALLSIPDWRRHPSHVRFVLPSGRDQEGPCMVEPTVGCSHCGFCQSWGH